MRFPLQFLVNDVVKRVFQDVGAANWAGYCRIVSLKRDLATKAHRALPFFALNHTIALRVEIICCGQSESKPQNDNVLFAQSRNVLLTSSRLGRWQKDNY